MVDTTVTPLFQRVSFSGVISTSYEVHAQDLKSWASFTGACRFNSGLEHHLQTNQPFRKKTSTRGPLRNCLKESQKESIGGLVDTTVTPLLVLKIREQIKTLLSINNESFMGGFMKWFKHHCDASDDYKILEMEDRFGANGYSCFWKTVEFVAGLWSGYGEPEIETTLKKYRSHLRTQSPKLKKMMEALSELNLMSFRYEGTKLIIRIENLKKIKDNATSAKTSANGLTLELKDYIVKREKSKCAYCDTPLYGQSFNFDHFIPVSAGGKSDASNLVLACEMCNKAKSLRDPQEFINAWTCQPGRYFQLRSKLDQELELEKDIEVKVEKEKKPAAPQFDFDLAYSKFKELFPSIPKGSQAEKRFKDQMKDQDDINNLTTSIANYRAFLNQPENKWRHPKQSFESFLGTKSSGFFWHSFIDMAQPKESGLFDFLNDKKEGA